MSEGKEKIFYKALEYCRNEAIESFTYETKEMKIIITKLGKTTIKKTKPITNLESEHAEQEVKRDNEIVKQDNTQIIYSEMNGIFYNSSDSKNQPLVSKGDPIKIGDVIGIIEVMKCFIEVKSEIAGILEEILVPNEVMIEHGQPLFIIRSITE